MDLLTKMGTFVRIVESGRISEAARQLRISPASASKQLAILEDEVGVRLVVRTTRSLTTTQAGRAYYERCLRILRDVDDAQAIGRLGTLGGIVRVSVPVTYGLASVVHFPARSSSSAARARASAKPPPPSSPRSWRSTVA